jgi:UDP-N-acetylglucosamine--N-acetylmuramyl-(pentapeptide) pyrophosphoryl-undecaprenol N-acetylglucosamine transferase
MSASDIVISRAGAMTISELAHMKKASILVPSPNVANNHQFMNAQVLALSNSAILISEDRLYTLTDTIKDLINDKNKREELENNISNFSTSNANKIIYNLMKRI